MKASVFTAPQFAASLGGFVVAFWPPQTALDALVAGMVRFALTKSRAVRGVS